MAAIVRTTFDAPIGRLGVVATEAGVRAVLLPSSKPRRSTPRGAKPAAEAVAGQAIAELREYLDGDRGEFDFPLFGDGIAPVALAIAILKTLHWSPSALGYVLGVRAGAVVAFLLVAGVVADRLPRRLILMSSDLLRFGAQGATAALILTKEARL